jgi:streptogramin lyase
VAVDGSGNVFVAELSNNAVKEIVAASGYTSVILLGSGFSFPRSVAVDGSGNVLVADSGNSAIKAIMTQGVNFSSAAIATSAPPTIPLLFTFDTGGTLGTPACCPRERPDWTLSTQAQGPAAQEQPITQETPAPSM